MAGLLDKERLTAPPGFNRWLVPPAALAIHLSIGMAYGFSVFWLPLSRATGIPAPSDISLLERIFSTRFDWPVSMLSWMYTLFFVFLGGSAAWFGPWVERVGPRKAGVAAACCWGSGLAISALGVYLHQIWMLWLGSGIIGGFGLGLGYISPVSTLIRWFPDRRGLATGLAIMGFGGGAIIGFSLADLLMQLFSSDGSVGVWQTFLTLGAIYFSAMMLGAFGYRLPPPGFAPAHNPGQAKRTGGYVDARTALRTPQFWLLWGVLCLNVAAGIGLIGMASPMLQEIFGGRLIGVDAPFASLTKEQAIQTASIGAAFAGLLSLFNIVGRIAWASLSDRIGRKTTYAIFFVLGAALFAAIPQAGQIGNLPLFASLFCIIMTMYGGGFATVPAYLADLFGPHQISAIHGRLLTAWSVAGVLGPVIVSYLRDWQLANGVPADLAYSDTMYVLAGLLLAGGVCNLCIGPVRAVHFTPVPELPVKVATGTQSPTVKGGSSLALALAWSAVGVPLLWGVWTTLVRSRLLFQ